LLSSSCIRLHSCMHACMRSTCPCRAACLCKKISLFLLVLPHVASANCRGLWSVFAFSMFAFFGLVFSTDSIGISPKVSFLQTL
jgi:hypothetical protein